MAGGYDCDMVDGGTTTVPCELYFANDEGFGLENRGVDPHVKVDMLPQHYVRKCMHACV
jgi:hypothetical protein